MNQIKSTGKSSMISSASTQKERQLKENMLLKELLQVTPPMSPDSPTDERKSTEAFVVPRHLIVEVAELKEIHPDASEERLVNLLKYS